MQRIQCSDHSLLNENIIRHLIHNRIYTILDFLQEDVEKVSTLTKLTLPQVLELRLDFINKYSACVVNGSKLINNRNENFISTGIARLDTILSGGIPIGFITELCGLAGSGKTNFCTQLSINCAKNISTNVLYIDTKGDFSALKLQKILQDCGYSHKDMASIMLRIKVVQVWTMDELIELLTKLKKKDIFVENLSIIFIDSLASLMLQYLGDDSKIGLSLLNIFTNYCKFLCRENNLSIFCVNIQTRWIEQDTMEAEDYDTIVKDQRIEKKHRCLGKYWQHIPALVLLLEMTQDKNSVCNLNMSIIKSNLGVSGLSCPLTLSSIGIYG